jgi:PKD repeat protein
MTSRISSLDSGYIAGDLSIYPKALDSEDTLYQVANNASTVTTQGISYTTKFIVVQDASSFPSSGLIKVGEETVYYASRTDTTFKELARGFSGSRQGPWPKNTPVLGCVFAEVHNAEKDAIINIEANIGVSDKPTDASLNGILKKQESRWLAPAPLFRAFPASGPAPLEVSFQNFSSGNAVSFLWDFGDGNTSVEVSPMHTYASIGTYTVQLSMTTSLGAQGIITKKSYITVNNNQAQAFFYVTPVIGIANTTNITFIDQTDGDIASRYWIFDDGTFFTASDPDVHTATHIYTVAGSYQPSLLVVFTDGTKKKLSLGDKIIIQ